MTNRYYPQQYQPPYQPLPHSGMGIASFVIGIVVILIFAVCVCGVIMMAVSAVKEKQTRLTRTVDDSESPDRSQSPDALQLPSEPGAIFPDRSSLLLVGMGSCVSMILALVGAILAAVSLCRPGRRVYAILGLVINGGFLFLVVCSTLVRVAGRH